MSEPKFTDEDIERLKKFIQSEFEQYISRPLSPTTLDNLLARLKAAEMVIASYEFSSYKVPGNIDSLIDEWRKIAGKE